MTHARIRLALVALSALACGGQGRRTAAPQTTTAEPCQGRVLELPRDPVQIEGVPGVQGFEGRSIALHAGGLLTDQEQAAGHLDESGCFYDTSGTWIGRWTRDGRLLETEDRGPPQIALHDGKLELSVNGIVETTFTVDGVRILRNDQLVATVTSSGAAAPPELVLRTLLLPDIVRTVRTRQIE